MNKPNKSTVCFSISIISIALVMIAFIINATVITVKYHN